MSKLILALVLIALASFGMTSLATAHGLNAPHSHYALRDPDDWGLWGVSDGDEHVWVLLMKANPKIPNDRRMLPGYSVNIPQGIVMTEDGRAVLIEEAVRSESPTAGRDTTQAVVARMEALQARQSRTLDALIWSLVALLALLLITALIAMSRGTAIRRRDDEIARLNEQHGNDVRQARQDGIAQERREREQRIRRDPYSGPPVLAAGLPTGPMAANFLIDAYRRQYPNPTDGDRNTALIRVEPTWVRGYNTLVGYAGDQLQPRDLMTEQPAWRGVFSSGVVLDVLQRCANGLFSEIGQQLSDDQVRPRQGIPVLDVNRLVWPELASQTAPVPAPTNPTAASASVSSTPAAPETARPAVPPGPRMFVIMGDVVVYRHPGDTAFHMVTITGLDIQTTDRGVTLRQNGAEIVLGTNAASDDRRAKVDEIVAHAGGSAS